MTSSLSEGDNSVCSYCLLQSFNLIARSKVKANALSVHL